MWNGSLIYGGGGWFGLLLMDSFKKLPGRRDASTCSHHPVNCVSECWGKIARFMLFVDGNMFPSELAAWGGKSWKMVRGGWVVLCRWPPSSPCMYLTVTLLLNQSFHSMGKMSFTPYTDSIPKPPFDGTKIITSSRPIWLVTEMHHTSLFILPKMPDWPNQTYWSVPHTTSHFIQKKKSIFAHTVTFAAFLRWRWGSKGVGNVNNWVENNGGVFYRLKSFT